MWSLDHQGIEQTLGCITCTALTSKKIKHANLISHTLFFMHSDFPFARCMVQTLRLKVNAQEKLNQRLNMSRGLETGLRTLSSLSSKAIFIISHILGSKIGVFQDYQEAELSRNEFFLLRISIHATFSTDRYYSENLIHKRHDVSVEWQ